MARSVKILGVIFALGATGIFFQNCGSSSFTSLSMESKESYSFAPSEDLAQDSNPPDTQVSAAEPPYDESDFSCPQGYIKVPPQRPYSYKGFCAAKYEMKDGASSRASGSPWVHVNRAQAIAACQSLGYGYDLISNNQWQTIARNVERVSDNWGSSPGAANSTNPYIGELNRGLHIYQSVDYGKAAADDDDDACYLTGQSCSKGIWSSYRRTHVLSNSEVIWDLGGNVFEWIKDDIVPSGENFQYAAVLPEGHPSRKTFGPEKVCESPNVTNPCGYGVTWLTNSGRGVAARRGGYWFGIYSGIFATSLDVPAGYSHMGTGFRCVYEPQ